MIVFGFFRAGFASALGLNNVEFGFMAAIPMLVFPARLLSSFIIEHLGRRKNFFTVTLVLSRLVWVGILCLPFILVDASKFRSAFFLMLLLASSALGAMCEPAWFSWIGDLVPEHMRARFWARRSLYVSMAGVIPTIVLALVRDTVTTHGRLGSQFTGFAVVFGFAVFCGVVDLIIHYGIPEPPMAKHEHQSERLKALLEPVKDPKFRPFLVFNGAWTFSLMLLGQFCIKHFFEVAQGRGSGFAVAGLSLFAGEFTIMALISTLSVFSGAVGYSIWGTLIQRYGNKPILQLCTIVQCFTPLPWLLVTPEHPYLGTALAFMIGGFTFSGVMVSRMNLMYGLSPRQNRSMYVAINLTVMGLCGALAPILSGYFMTYMEGKDLLGFSGFFLLCILTSMCRFYSRMLLYRVREGKGVTPGYVVRRITEANPFRVFSSIYVLSAPASEEKKLSAVSRLADSRSRLATQDLVEHLDDPSPKVREEAVYGLAKSKDPEAVDALIEKLGSPEHGLEAQSARALGEIGDQRSVQPLIDSLDHPDPRVRASAAQALGDIGDRRAREPLSNMLKKDNHQLAYGSYATALSALGEISAIWHILPVMRNTRSALFRRQLAVAIGNLLGKPKVFYGYLDEESKVFGRRAAKIFDLCRRLISRRHNNPLYTRREALLNLIDEAETAYLQENWIQCAGKIGALMQACTEAIFQTMSVGGALSPHNAGQHLDKFEKILLIMGQDEKLGMQLWYSAVLSRQDDPEFEKLTFEGCLLDIYMLELVTTAVLPPRRQPRGDQGRAMNNNSG